MAKIEMGILGGFSGRVGTVVGYRRRGAWFIRAYRPHIRDRKSAAQLKQRSRFKAMIQFASPATPVLRVGLKKQASAQGLTEGNLFLKINHLNFQNNQNFPIAIDYPKLQFSQGNLAAPRAVQWSVDEGGVLSVRWSGEGGRLTDRIHIYIYCPSAATGLSADSERGRDGLQLLLPQEFASEELHVWAFASSKDGKVSGTVYGASGQPVGDGGAGFGVGQRTEAPAGAGEAGFLFLNGETRKDFCFLWHESGSPLQPTGCVLIRRCAWNRFCQSCHLLCMRLVPQ